jgi:hypothetical protein
MASLRRCHERDYSKTRETSSQDSACPSRISYWAQNIPAVAIVITTVASYLSCNLWRPTGLRVLDEFTDGGEVVSLTRRPADRPLSP